MVTVSVEEKVQEVISKMLGVDIVDVTLEASVLNDLGADSLDVIDIAMELEEAFDIPEIPDKELEGVSSVQDFVDAVKRGLNE